MSVHLVGGGLGSAHDASLTAPFAAEAARRAGTAGAHVVVVVAGSASDGEALAAAVLAGAERDPLGSPAARPGVEVIVLGAGGTLEPASLDGADAIVVGGGLASGLGAALAPAAAAIRSAVERGTPYLGVSAGAQLAASTALVGGWRIGGVPVCPPEAAGGLDEVEVSGGIGLVDVAIDAHAAQRGTLSRLVAATEAGIVPGGLAIDEATALVVGGGPLVALGAGSVWSVAAVEGGVRVATLAPDD